MKSASLLHWIVTALLLIVLGATLQLLQPARGQAIRLVPGSGDTFIRWGSEEAPAGTELIYSGFGYANFITHAPRTPIVLQTGDPAATGTLSQGDLLYPLHTASGGMMPPGIMDGTFLKGAVCLAPRATATIWGTHTPPQGWSVLYRGYSMGGDYRDAGVGTGLVVEAEEFDVSVSSGGSNVCRLFGTATQLLVPGGSDPSGRFVKCAVIMKD